MDNQGLIEFAAKKGLRGFADNQFGREDMPFPGDGLIFDQLVGDINTCLAKK